MYEWQIGNALPPVAPTVQALQVDGRVNPAGISDPQPQFSWVYSDASGSAQTMYRLIVSSTRENLDAHFGDLWDTGDVASGATTVPYAGAALNSSMTYFWQVRVRNAKGVWSETW